ncbi:hypothetical protein BDY17DRAFT_299488 [Neohortaea acidophila]|uniref:Secreted protein n=1 Tax=Neohortaea acidophila TaxID=245834 RepID=A0A6A6PPZ8_9PEZI|nr:uncharacterized protein BDY17DRAFT_299488 [Neohortaea acidophila]KAF2481704.1 hypothetical protein BDY17DRAFT_299488 [Neohortaea acidophila]
MRHIGLLTSILSSALRPQADGAAWCWRQPLMRVVEITPRQRVSSVCNGDGSDAIAMVNHAGPLASSYIWSKVQNRPRSGPQPLSSGPNSGMR